jgi:hypothetical protein
MFEYQYLIFSVLLYIIYKNYMKIYKYIKLNKSMKQEISNQDELNYYKNLLD